MTIAAPARQRAAPVASYRSGRSPSMSHSHASDAAMEMPPYDTYFKNRGGPTRTKLGTGFLCRRRRPDRKGRPAAAGQKGTGGDGSSCALCGLRAALYCSDHEDTPLRKALDADLVRT